LYGKELDFNPSMCGKIKHVLRERGSKLLRQKTATRRTFSVISIKDL
jgi:cell division protein FtsX